MHRFFVDRAPAERAFLTGEQARQIATVLRLQPGERVILVADLIDHEVELQAVAPAQGTVLWEEARGPHLLDAAREDDVSLVVGPEGGLTSEEIEVARQHDAVIASLGSRILRAETAGIAAVAMLVGARDR